jgi:hypothetical protein
VTFARLPRITRERLVRELAKEVLAAYYPSGCTCPFRGCDWCKNIERVKTRIRKLVDRLEKVES